MNRFRSTRRCLLITRPALPGRPLTTEMMALLRLAQELSDYPSTERIESFLSAIENTGRAVPRRLIRSNFGPGLVRQRLPPDYDPETLTSHVIYRRKISRNFFATRASALAWSKLLERTFILCCLTRPRAQLLSNLRFAAPFPESCAPTISFGRHSAALRNQLSA